MRVRTRTVLASLLVVGVLSGCATAPPRVLATQTPEPAGPQATSHVTDPVVFPLSHELPGDLPPASSGSSPAAVAESPTPEPEPVLPVPPATPDPPAIPEPPVAIPEPPAARVNCAKAKAKCVALTLDDGPVPATAKVLDLFKKLDVKVTFFVLGEMAKVHPEIVRRMLAEGHAVGNHSWSHPEFWKCSKGAIRKELTKTSLLLTKLGEQPALMRPPYGEWDPRVAKMSKALGLAGVLWDVDSLDWKSRNTKKVTKLVLRKVRPGSIILTHDIFKTTRKAYPAIIKGLRAKGYTLVTVPELFAGKLHAGGRYANA